MEIIFTQLRVKLYDKIFRIGLEVLRMGCLALDACNFQSLVNLSNFSASMLE